MFGYLYVKQRIGPKNCVITIKIALALYWAAEKQYKPYKNQAWKHKN